MAQTRNVRRFLRSVPRNHPDSGYTKYQQPIPPEHSYGMRPAPTTSLIRAHQESITTSHPLEDTYRSSSSIIIANGGQVSPELLESEDQHERNSHQQVSKLIRICFPNSDVLREICSLNVSPLMRHCQLPSSTILGNTDSEILSQNLQASLNNTISSIQSSILQIHICQVLDCSNIQLTKRLRPHFSKQTVTDCSTSNALDSDKGLQYLLH
jgi:hypothetical protein